MSLVKGLKRAFGFSTDGDEIDDEVDYYDGTRRSPYQLTAGNNAQEQPSAADAGTAAPQQPASAAPTTAVPTAINANRLPDSISSVIIKLINSNLPPIVTECIDINAERQAIEAAIGPQFTEFVEAEKSKALSADNLQCDKYKASLAEATEKLNALTAQSKALTSQNADLKTKLAATREECEQQGVELKGAQNKLKVMQLREAQHKITEEEVKRLHTLCDEQKDKLLQCENRNAQLEVQLQDATAKLNDLQPSESAKAELEQLKDAIAAKDGEITKLAATLAERETELTKQNAQIADLQSDLDIAAEIQKKVEQAEENRRKCNEQISQLKQSLDTAETAHEAEIGEKDSEISKLQTENNSLKKEIESIKAKIANDSSVQKQRDIDTANSIDRLKSQLSRNNEKATILETQVKDLEASLSQAAEQSKEVVDKANEEVNILKEQLQKAHTETEELKQQLTDSQRTLSSTQAALMSSEAQLKDTIDALNDANDKIAAMNAMSRESATAYEPSETPTPTVRGNEIDLDDIDWLTPVPFNEPEPEPEPEPEAEKPKPRIEDDRQMSLF